MWVVQDFNRHWMRKSIELCWQERNCWKNSSKLHAISRDHKGNFHHNVTFFFIGYGINKTNTTMMTQCKGTQRSTVLLSRILHSGTTLPNSDDALRIKHTQRKINKHLTKTAWKQNSNSKKEHRSNWLEATPKGQGDSDWNKCYTLRER